MGNDIVRGHNHLNGKFRSYGHSKCNLQAKNTFVPMFAYNSSNYDNHLSITKLAKEIKTQVSAKYDENHKSISMGCIKALDMFKLIHPLSLDAITKTLSDGECERLKKFK